jgi:hypothetical protein
MLDESTINDCQTKQGEMVMIHCAFRHSIKIPFPRGAFMSLK